MKSPYSFWADAGLSIADRENRVRYLMELSGTLLAVALIGLVVGAGFSLDILQSAGVSGIIAFIYFPIRLARELYTKGERTGNRLHAMIENRNVGQQFKRLAIRTQNVLCQHIADKERQWIKIGSANTAEPRVTFMREWKAQLLSDIEPVNRYLTEHEMEPLDVSEFDDITALDRLKEQVERVCQEMDVIASESPLS